MYFSRIYTENGVCNDIALWQLFFAGENKLRKEQTNYQNTR